MTSRQAATLYVCLGPSPNAELFDFAGLERDWSTEAALLRPRALLAGMIIAPENTE